MALEDGHDKRKENMEHSRDQAPSEIILAMFAQLRHDSSLVRECFSERPLEFLENVNMLFERRVDSVCLVSEELVSRNFLRLLVESMTWKNLIQSMEIASLAYNVLTVIYDSYPERVPFLEELRIGSVASEILAEEAKTGLRVQCFHKTKYVFLTPLLISRFLPPLESSSCHYEVDSISQGMLFSGRHLEDLHRARAMTGFFLTYFSKILDACRAINCSSQYHAVLFKMISWADDLGCLTLYVEVEDLLALAKSLILSSDENKIVIGFAMVYVLKTNHVKVFREINFHKIMEGFLVTVSENLMSRINVWAEEIYKITITYWLPTDMRTPTSDCLENGVKRSNEVLDCILPCLREGLQATETPDSYRRLNDFLFKDVLDTTTWSSPEMVLRPEVRNKFQSLVITAVSALDALLVDQVYFVFESDMMGLNSYAGNPGTVEDVRLGLYDSSSFDRVLGPSLSPMELKNNSTMRVLRVLSILSVVNENWGVLIGNLTGECLIDRKYFISKTLDQALVNMLKVQWNIPTAASRIALNYPFLLSFNLRASLLRAALASDPYKVMPDPIDVVVPRHKLISTMLYNVDTDRLPKGVASNFRFEGEHGTGRGPTKEFYTELSHELQKRDLNLWITEQVEDSSGIEYAYSSCGLFPLPGTEKNAKSESTMKMIGTMIGKSLSGGYLMDVNFSQAFYKCAFRREPFVQHLTLQDLKDAMPAAHGIAKCLVDSYKKMLEIATNAVLTPGQKLEEWSAFGRSFEDLCINFTVPGLPDIELKEGCKNIHLNFDNFTTYLQLLVWKILYEGPRKAFESLQEGLRETLPMLYMELFYPDEIEILLCGVKMERWTVEYLREHCDLCDELTADTPAVRFLFEVLSSLTADEQSLFLRFVTGSSRLPCGGLKNLKPRLTVRRKSAAGDNQDLCLPTAMTCFNALFITEYSSKEVLRAKLLMAIEEGLGSFDFL